LPTAGLLILLADPRITRNIDPGQTLRYFSWGRFAIIALVYTAFVFWIELAKDGPFIFSRDNLRSRPQVLLAHAMFLTILLCCYRLSTFIVPMLPFWMTDTYRVSRSTRSSFAEIVPCLAALGMAYFERRWLYRGPARTSPE
jgi:NADH:ubiquinone oxidoreductase subunit 2 (subunit N)